jgi:hypothetical protein
MVDQKNLGINDITQWARQAPPEQVISAVHKLLDQVGGYSDTDRQRFQTDMSPQSRKLFQPENV